MLKKILVFIPIALSIGAMQVHAGTLPVPGPTPMRYEAPKNSIAEQQMLLTNRHANAAINSVFADNMLLTIAYLTSEVKNANDINWDEVRKPRKIQFTLEPGEVFAFHNQVMAKYADKTVLTTNTRFSANDGFKSSGYLYGDGVCHLASLFNQVGSAAGLGVTAPVNHDFAPIPDLPREFGTAIYYAPNNSRTSEQQNLYIENTKQSPVTFTVEITVDRIIVDVSVKE